MIIIEPNDSTADDADVKRTTQGTSEQDFSQHSQAASDPWREKLGSMGERFKDMQQEYGEKAREQVRARPLAAFGAALAIGMVVTKLFTRR